MKHKHRNEIIAWANGAKIEYRIRSDDEWRSTNNPGWYEDIEYRVAPTPKPDIVLYTHITNCGVAYLKGRKSLDLMENLKLTICGKTGWLKEAEVIE